MRQCECHSMSGCKRRFSARDLIRCPGHFLRHWVPVMTFEQPAKLNRYLSGGTASPAPGQPLLARFRLRDAWPTIRFCFPFLLLSSVTFTEMWTFRAWLDGRNVWPKAVLAFITSAVFVCLTVTIAASLQVLANKLQKRRLSLEAKCVKISPAKYSRIKWKNVSRWVLQTLPGGSNLKLLILEYYFSSRTQFPRRWGIILKNPEETDTLRKVLSARAAAGTSAAPVVENREPEYPLPSQRSRRHLWYLALSLWFFLHGFPVFIAGVTARSEARTTRSRGQLTQAGQHNVEKAAKLVIRTFHIQTSRQWEILFRTSGAILMAFGAFFYILQLKSLAKWKKRDGQLSSLATGAPEGTNTPA